MNDLLPLIMKALLLQPSDTARKLKSFNLELYVDFTAAQIKTLSFVAFFIRIFRVRTNTTLAAQTHGELVLVSVEKGVRVVKKKVKILELNFK